MLDAILRKPEPKMFDENSKLSQELAKKNGNEKCDGKSGCMKYEGESVDGKKGES